jgi:hypothetical protein
MIIASSLATVMLLLVWSLFGIYSKLSTKGERVATELQLVRSISTRLRSDLNRLVVTPRRLGLESIGHQAAALESSSSAQLPSGPYLVGDANSIRVVVPASRIETVLSDDAVSGFRSNHGPSVFDVVEYTWHPRRGPRETHDRGSLFDTSSESLDSNHDQPVGGLTRQSAPWRLSSLSMRETSGAVDSSTSRTFGRADEIERQQDEIGYNDTIKDRIPEVTRFQIRYFDGASWKTNWDSRTLDRLPVAVEVRFELDTKYSWPDPVNEELSNEELSNEETELREQREREQRDAQNRRGPSSDSITSGPTSDFSKEDIDPGYRIVLTVDLAGTTRAEVSP